MPHNPNNLEWALDDVSASSAGGAPFLIAYGATFIVTAVLSFFLPLETAALIAMFQGGIALPIAFWLERRMSSKRMDPGNPLKALSGLMAGSQALGLPALIIAYDLNPVTVPAVLAALGGMHFLSYSWLHRTRLYAVLAGTVSLGAFLLLLLLSSAEFPATMFFIGLVYWVAAPLVYRHAARLVRESSAQHPNAAGDMRISEP